LADSAVAVRIIVGLTGPNASGKSVVAAHLQQLGFACHSLSDIVREEASARGLDHTREHLIAVGNDLRREAGPGVLATRIRSRLAQRDVVDSIRNPTEVEELRRETGFHLLGLDASVELRFQRSRQRGRLGDGASLEDFMAKEEAENTTDPAAQQLRATLQLADIKLTNDGELQSLLEAVDQTLTRWTPTPR
jgi:dephospho-CoA kinase